MKTPRRGQTIGGYRFGLKSKESLKRALGSHATSERLGIEMRVLAIAAIITSLAVPAFAEADPDKAAANKAEEQKKRDNEELGRAYKETLKRTSREQPGQKTDRYDPWRTAR